MLGRPDLKASQDRARTQWAEACEVSNAFRGGSIAGVEDQSARIALQWFERAWAKEALQDRFDDALPILAVQLWTLGLTKALDNQANLPANHVAVQISNAREVQLLDEFDVN